MGVACKRSVTFDGPPLEDEAYVNWFSPWNRSTIAAAPPTMISTSFVPFTAPVCHVPR